MLVLARKVGQSIVIGNITVHVGEIRRGRVRIGIDAPRDQSIVRAELVEAHDDDDIRLKPVEWQIFAHAAS